MIPVAFKRSLHAKVTISIAIPLTVVLGIIILIEHARHRAVIMNDLSSLASYSGQMIQSSLRHAMLESDFDDIQGILDTIGENHDIETVYLLNTAGEIIFAPRNQGVGTYLDNTNVNCMPCHKLGARKRPDGIIVTNAAGKRMFRSMHPIENSAECARCHDPDQPLLGLLLTDISMASVEKSLAADLRENLLWGILTIFITILIINLITSRMVLRRLNNFKPAIESLGHGKLPTSIVDNQPDEIGQLAHVFNTMSHQIETRNTENHVLYEDLRVQSSQRSQLLKRLITAQEDERKRIARELHDELGQFLSGLVLTAEAVERFVSHDPDRAVENVKHMRSLTTEALDRMYELILDLRPSILDDLGLAAAMRAYADRLLRNTTLEFTLESERLPRRMPAEIETTLYRIFQEALSNIVRHAKASHVHVRLKSDIYTFETEITDDGQGFDPASVALDGKNPQGLGLLGMRERAIQCGGDLVILSQSGSGTTIKISIPYKGETAPYE